MQVTADFSSPARMMSGFSQVSTTASSGGLTSGCQGMELSSPISGVTVGPESCMPTSTGSCTATSLSAGTFTPPAAQDDNRKRAGSWTSDRPGERTLRRPRSASRTRTARISHHGPALPPGVAEQPSSFPLNPASQSVLSGVLPPSGPAVTVSLSSPSGVPGATHAPSRHS